MNIWTSFIIVALVGYILGSISFAVIISKFYGINILKAGSGSPGATNVKRVVGKTAGNLVFLLDCLKGVIATAWPLIFLNQTENLSFYLSLTGLIAAVLGHNFSIFLKFQGGKGIATTMGGILILMPWSLLIGLIIWLIIFYSTRYVSLASILFGLSLPMSAIFIHTSNAKIALSLLLAILILIRHQPNIKRLLNGTENRFTKTTKEE